MFTETELRDALQHSADRAGTLADRAPVHRTRLLVPLAAAACVAATAVAVAMVASPDGSSRHAAQPAASSPMSTPAATTSAAPSQDAHVPVDLGNAIDLVQLAHGARTYVTIGGNGDPEAGSETIEHFVGGTRTLDVSVVDSPAFDPGRIPRDHPVAIAGTTGYYAKFKLYPLDANTGPGSDKYTAPWTIAFRSPSGNWVFASIENGVDFDGVADPGTIAAAYDSLGVRFVAGASRLAFRTGYLPDGLRFAQTTLGYGESMTYLTSGGRSIEIDVLHDRAAGDCVSQCGAYKQVGDYTINVVSTGYVPDAVVTEPVKGGSSATVSQPHPATPLEQRILDGLQLAPDLSDPSTYWTITDALG